MIGGAGTGHSASAARLMLSLSSSWLVVARKELPCAFDGLTLLASTSAAMSVRQPSSGSIG
jgi:hypothetical protein